MTLVKENLAHLKIIVVGNSCVGKSCLIRSYESGHFSPGYLSTIGMDYFKKKISVKNNKEVVLNLWDTAGQERFHSLTQNYVKGTDGLLICVALDEGEYIKQIKYWIEKVQEIINESEIKILIVGTKSDLVSEQVCNKVIQNIEKTFNNKYKCVLTSAKDSKGVDHAFKEIANMIIRDKEELNDMDIQSVSSFKTTKMKSKDHKKKKCC